MTINAVKREIPDYIEGYGKVKHYQGAFAKKPEGNIAGAKLRCFNSDNTDKTVSSIKEAIKASGLKSGMTISFHHHLRNGDYVVNMVLDACAEMGIKELTLFPTALFGVHKKVIDHIKSGVVTKIMGSVNGPIGQLVSEGGMSVPVVLRSHGGRPRAVMAGDVHIDVAFIGAPTADKYGNICGTLGKSACGSLGYAITDAKNAAHVIAVTDNLVQYPLSPKISIPQYLVDQVVVVDSIGDPAKIATGAARITRSPVDLRIAQDSFRLMKAAGIVEPGFSFQMGVGGASLAAAVYLEEYMADKQITGSFGLGGVGGYMASMHDKGMFRTVFDVQSFDAAVTKSMISNPSHIEIDLSLIHI